ncbi:hypothetical protein AVEN_181122-1 [Araneus ventricosus]|uniref:Reverse transcriptase/retrotransposon-derived protein RNase H-like domain-containing protein n=1 Tax=Araneus ventricosus TaxID=182803 RepID=A0A4Y2P9K5_ARAVE|nr:hypothetical protein AVEN_181122-1 [Araneus ventricosus]
MQLRKLYGGQLLVVPFHKLIDIIAIHLQYPDFGKRHNLVDYRLHRVLVWKWCEQEQQAFQTLKQRLVTPPVLRQVDPTKPFIIRTDASGYALGAVLLQGDDSPTLGATEEGRDSCLYGMPLLKNQFNFRNHFY